MERRKPMMRPRGVYVAMMTPFSQDGALKLEVVREMVEFLVEKGVDGLFPVSSVGESVHLTMEERVLLMKTVVEAAKGRVPVVPGVGTTNPYHSTVLAVEASKMGCDGVVVAPPYFYKISEGMLETYFQSIHDGVGIPMILYNIPLFTQPLSPELVGRLSLRPRIVGLKESSGSMVEFVNFMDEVKRKGGEMSFLTGREETFLAALAMGADGCMVATAAVVPEVMIGIKEAYERAEMEKARRLQLAVIPLIRACFSLPFPAGFKLAMEARGFPMGPPRQPLSERESKEADRLKERMKELIREAMAALG